MNRFRCSYIVSIALLLVGGTFTLSAQAAGDPRPWHANPDAAILASAYAQVLSELSSVPTVGDFKTSDLQAALDSLSVAQQEYTYVKRAETASFWLPGLGQLRDGDSGLGALFLAGDLGLFAGTVLGTYFLLPADLQFGQLNYLTTPLSTIKDDWEGHNLLDYLPSLAVAVGGAILSHALRFISADNAGELARENIQDKRVTFQPEPILLMPGTSGMRMGMGLGMHMRF